MKATETAGWVAPARRRSARRRHQITYPRAISLQLCRLGRQSFATYHSRCPAGRHCGTQRQCVVVTTVASRNGKSRPVSRSAAGKLTCLLRLTSRMVAPWIGLDHKHGAWPRSWIRAVANRCVRNGAEDAHQVTGAVLQFARQYLHPLGPDAFIGDVAAEAADLAHVAVVAEQWKAGVARPVDFPSAGRWMR